MAALESSAHLFICRLGWLQDDICIPFRCRSLPRPGRSRCLPLHQGGTAPHCPCRGATHSHQLGRRRAQDETCRFHKGSNPGRDLEGARKGEAISSTAQTSHKCHSTGTMFGAEEPAGPGARVGCSLCIPKLQVSSPLTVTRCRWGHPAQHHSLWQAHAVLKKARKPPFLPVGPSSQFFSCPCLVVLLLIFLLQILNSHLSTSQRPSSSARRRTLGYHASCPSQILTSH